MKHVGATTEEKIYLTPYLYPLQKENRRLQESLQEKFSFGNYVFNSPGMQEAVNLALRAAASNASILITGESGTATNADLHQLVKEKKFREDFYFRLNVITIELPPLRQRREDIPLLADFFIKKFSRRENKPIESISKDALNLLVRYFYPGNIRELENIIQRAIILARGSVLTLQDLPVFIRGQAGDMDGMGNNEEELTLPEILAITEKRVIIKVLKNHKHNQCKAAKELGISESGLRYKIRTLKISKE